MATHLLKDLPEVRAKLKPTLILVRHGDTPFEGPPDRHQGWDNTGLNKQGKQDARKVAKVLTSLPVREIFTSDLHRAAETAGEIWDAQGLRGPLHGRYGLRPWDVGQYVGKIKEGVQREIDAYEFKKPDAPIPGGESFNKFRDRYLLQLKALLEMAKDHPEEGVTVAVTHSWNFILTLAWLRAGADHNKLDKDVLTHGKDVIPGPGEGLVLSWKSEGWAIRKLPM